MTYPRVIQFRGTCGDMPGIGETMTPDPRTRDLPDGLKLVPTVWAQRAVNAWNAARGISTRLTVDGVAGTHTRTALLSVGAWLITTGQASSLPAAQIVDTAHVSIPAQVAAVLSGPRRVADPTGSTIGTCSWTPVPQTVTNVSTSSSSTAVASAPSDGGAIAAESPVSSVGFFSQGWVTDAIAFVGAAAVGGLATAIVFRKKRGRR